MVASDPRQGGLDVMEMVQQQRARELAQLGVPQEEKQQGLMDPEEVDEEWLMRKVHEDKQTFLKSSRELLDEGEGKNVCPDASDLFVCDEIAAAGCDNGDGDDGAARKQQRRKRRQRKRKGRRSRVDTELNPRVQRNHREVVHRALEDRGDVNEGIQSQSNNTSANETTNVAASGSTNGMTSRGNDTTNVAPNSLDKGMSSRVNDTTSVAPEGSKFSMRSRVNDTTFVAPESSKLSRRSGVNDTTNVAPQSSKNDGNIPALAARIVEKCDYEDSDSEEDSEDESEDEADMPTLLPRTSTKRLQAPKLDSGEPVTGSSKTRHRVENKRRRQAAQLAQEDVHYWQTHEGDVTIPTPKTVRGPYKGQMCPSGLALEHPAAELLLQYSQLGCPVETGQDWTVEMMTAAIERGPHRSALVPAAMEQLQAEVEAKVKCGQCRVVEWDDIKHNPPAQLKISPIAMIPHKSKPFRAILDVSYGIQVSPSEKIPSVNETSVKTAPAGAIDQLGHSLSRIIHAMAQADDDAKVFMAKWDIKDGFWRLDCEEGAEWNFAYVLPQEEGKPVKLIIPTSLQMGWIESPPYFCAASETGRDVAHQYAESPVGSLENHKFLAHALQGMDYETFVSDEGLQLLRYMIEVYVDDYISLAIPRTKEDLRHIANAVLTGIHDVFPPDELQESDPISYKKLLKLEGMWALVKDILGFTFDGENKTIWLEGPKRDVLLTTIKHWLNQSEKRNAGVPFDEFRTVIAKLRHAFISIPGGKGLLSPCNSIIRTEPSVVFFHKNPLLRQAIGDCRTILHDSTLAPTKCKELVSGWPDYVGVKDASGHGVGGIIIGETKRCVPTVFRFEWPDDIKAEINSESNPTGKLTNSDLECAGLLMLWLVMEDVCKITSGDRVALFSDNQPTVSWVKRMASKSSIVAGQLIRALALRLKLSGASPLTPLHIRGIENAMTDIPSRSFGEPKKWHCPTDKDLLTLFSETFPLPNQQCWTVYRVSLEISTKILSVLRMKLISMDVWRQLPSRGKHIGDVGAATSHLWEWTLTYREQRSKNESEHLQDSQPSSEKDTSIANKAKSELQQSVALLRPLERRVPWTAE